MVLWAPAMPIQPGPKIGGFAMLDNIVKLLDVVEDLIAQEDATDPKDNDKLVSIGSRLEALSMDIKDKTERP
jgi:hypothetical protein